MPSILETFVIVFDGDATKAKLAQEAIQQSSKTTAENVVKDHEKIKEKLDETGEHAKGLSHHFDEVKKHATEMAHKVVEQIAEIVAAFVALAGIEKTVEAFFEQSEISDMLGEQARSLGISVETLDQWGQAVRRVHGTAEGFTQSLITLGVNLERVNLGAGQRSRKFFEELGIDVAHTKSAFDLLPQLNEKFQHLTPAKALAIGRGIGLDEGTIRLLQLPIKEFEELIERQKELGSITKEDTEVAEKFNRQWLDVKQLFRNIIVNSNTAWLPMLAGLLEHVEHVVVFLRDHSDLVTGFFIALGAGILVATEAMWGLSAAFLVNPMTWIVGGILLAIVAFAFLYDDIKAFTSGHNSLIGEMAKRYPLFAAAIDLVREHLDLLKPILSALWITHNPAIDMVIEQWKRLAEYIDKVITLYHRMKEAITNFNPGAAVLNVLTKTQDIERKLLPGLNNLGDTETGQGGENQTTEQHKSDIQPSRIDRIEGWAIGVYRGLTNWWNNPKDDLDDALYKTNASSGGSGSRGSFPGFSPSVPSSPEGATGGGSGGMNLSPVAEPGGPGTIAERHNNPGNLRGSPDAIGRAGGFAVFSDAVSGFAGMGKLLVNYARQGRDTVASIISKWAPPNENNTNAYIATLAREMGVDPNAHLNVNDPNVMVQLMNGIARVESGHVTWSQDTIRKGAERALHIMAPTGNPAIANATPFHSSSKSISHALSTGNIIIQTDTNDPSSMSNAFLDRLNQHYNDLMPNYADGIDI